MSTGDQSEYMRGKMAERGTSQGVQFTEDGFDKWAASTAPARAGQAEKMPAETQMANTGGAMTPSQARKVAEKYARQAAKKAKEMGIVPFKGGAMCGGRSVSIAGINIEIPEIVEKAVEYGEKVLNFALLVKDKLPEIKEAIQDEIIDNTRDPSVTAKDRAIAKELLPLLDRILGYLKTLEAIKSAADAIKRALGGSGRGGMRGGASAAENFKKAVEFLKTAYNTLFRYVSFLVDNGKFLLQMLKISALQPIGKQILDKIKPILSLGGINVGGRRNKPAKCECSDSEEYYGGMYTPPSDPRLKMPEKPKRGGFMDMFGQQKQVATMESGMKGSPMDDGGMQMGDYGMMGDYNMGGPMKYESTYNPTPMKKEKVDQRKKQELMESLEKLKQQIRDSDSDEERLSLKNRYRQIQEKLEEMDMRGGKTSYTPSVSTSRRRQPDDSDVTSTAVGGRKSSARGTIVKKVMREKGLSLPQASKYVKEHGLY
jgi:hypothetical protein